MNKRFPLAVLFCLLAAATLALAADDAAVTLPDDVKPVWELNKAFRESTPTRERICLNGLWRWQPASKISTQTPAEHWGYFKVPGCWPGITDYLQKDCQTLYTHPSWKESQLGNVTAAWYEREFTVPEGFQGRRIALHVEYLNSFAAVYIDGKPAGELRFPGGELDLTKACGPESLGKHRLSLLVVALPLKGVLVSYTDTASARAVQGTVARRGLCGDVYLVGEPAEARIRDVQVETSVRKWRMTCDTALAGLAPEGEYRLHADILENDTSRAEFTSPVFKASDLHDGRFAFSHDWKPAKLWDIHTPQNTYQLRLVLLDARGQTLDVAGDVRFGFREFWIDGRDFYLNGSRIFLSAVPFDNAQVSAKLASYDAACASLKRLQSFGINFVYTHNYDCEPGSHLGFAEILRAADDVGMLVSFSQPHFSHYEWKATDADQNNGYAQHAEYYVRAAQNHPAVVCYSMSHNATGYDQDMNPDMIDGRQDPRDNWGANNARLALRAEAIVRRLDPSRFVYHHASGNLGTIHSSNFYPNFAPIQELSDWFEHWATAGVKPVFTCEYGAPFTWDWATYRGWYKGERSFGSAQVPWEFCFAEWNAQFLGDRAFRISDAERVNLRWEAGQFRGDKLWHRWDYPYEIGSRAFDDRHEVFARYLTDNWRAFRTWGVSANSPWEHGHFWKPREGIDKSRRELKVDWENLQRPGFSADFIDQRYERMDLAFEPNDWLPTAAGKALLRNNRPLLAYIGGEPAWFTSHDHNFFPGETVEKQLILINNSRETVSCQCAWTFEFPTPEQGQQRVEIKTGEQERIPLTLKLPDRLEPGKYALTARVTFGNGEFQDDALTIHILPRPAALRLKAKIAIFDPPGQTASLLKSLGIDFQPVDARADLTPYDILVVGKSALTTAGAVPNVQRVADGLKVIIFEQESEVLEKRLGFRVVEYGLRQVFPRVANHPALAGMNSEHWENWRGAATLVPPRLKYELRPQHGPTVLWCDIPVSRVWRCGNRGNVASVLIEKPARGDFLPILDGGFSLQYSPLMEYRQGRGMIVFCQLDVAGRTESDPAAEALAMNLMTYVAAWKPAPQRQALYIGAPAGKQHFAAVGIAVDSFAGDELKPEQVLIVGPGAGKSLAGHSAAIAAWLKSGGQLLAIGLDQDEANSFLPVKIATKQGEHIAAYFEPFAIDSLLTGVGPADVHNRDPRKLPLMSSGATVVGDGVLARAADWNVVFCQLAPWEFADEKQFNLRRTHRRSSFLLSRLLGNMGIAGATPILNRLQTPVETNEPKRFLNGLYIDQPQEWDDPYRFFRW